MTKLYRMLDAVWYWLQCHVRPGTWNFYKLNLAGVDPTNPKKYGYLEPFQRMELAAWAALRDYVECGAANDPAEWGTESEGVGDASWNEYIAVRKKNYDEVLFLYEWYMGIRVNNDRELTYLCNAWSTASTASGKQMYWEQLRKLRTLMEQEDNEMFLRLIAVRGELCT